MRAVEAGFHAQTPRVPSSLRLPVKQPDQAPSPEPDHEDEDRLRAERRRKLDELRAAGVDPFPPNFPDGTPIADVLSGYERLQAGEET